MLCAEGAAAVASVVATVAVARAGAAVVATVAVVVIVGRAAARGDFDPIRVDGS